MDCGFENKKRNRISKKNEKRNIIYEHDTTIKKGQVH